MKKNFRQVGLIASEKMAVGQPATLAPTKIPYNSIFYMSAHKNIELREQC